MTLPAMFSEAEAIDEVSAQVERVREKMTASASREWLEAGLCELIRQGLVDESQVISDADSGDEVADAALCKVYAEKVNHHGQPSIHLTDYALRVLERGPVRRPRGRPRWDNWRRDFGIAVLVYLTVRRFGLAPTRNRGQRRQQRPSACSIVAAALGRHRINVDDKRVENIWLSLQGQVGRYLLTGLI